MRTTGTLARGILAPLVKAGAEIVHGMDDVLSSSVNGSGYNENFGLLGSNKATENSVKLFPLDCQIVVDEIASKLKELTGKIYVNG